MSIQPKFLFFIFLIVASLVISSALFELYQSKKEMNDLMAQQSHSLLETTLAASNNALLSYETIDAELKKRLLNNANMIKLLYERNQISDKLLKKIANENNIYRINIFNNKGVKLYRSHKQIHFDLDEKNSPPKFLQPIFIGQLDTLIIGMKGVRYKDGVRFAIAVSAKNRSAIILNINAEELLKFRKQIGFGSLLKNVTQSNEIIYAALQDSNNILAASGDVQHLEALSESNFLQNALEDSVFASRTIESDTLEIFEAVHPFVHNSRVVGLFRLGLSLEPLNTISERLVRRIIIIGLVLFILGSLLLAYIFTHQNFDILKRKFKVIEGYSNKVIQNVSDAVIVLNEKNEIKIFNDAAALLFDRKDSLVNGKKLEEVFNNDNCKNIFASKIGLEQIECSINNQKKYLLVSKSEFTAEEDLTNSILVMRDLTNQKLMEDQIQRKERLVAMGELASGVAHEIRNPLNTISTITQQLNKDFQPKENEEEFFTLSNLVAKEVKRINETIKSFLHFSKPEKIVLKEFFFSELLEQIENQYKPMLSEKSTVINIEKNWDGKVNWDRNQILQVIMNLIQNAYDSIESNGKISVKVEQQINNQILLTISDNGNGIPKHILNKIFNLYFTTKAKGTGIGLSMVQRIIIEHGGTISVESTEGEGTTFSILIPINLEQ
ncbi:MAG: GHKL domain-containing protein [Ignavibacteriae bacterium]|nr:GHKL domain-containing protein [Ignavibacteriota bacterium]